MAQALARAVLEAVASSATSFPTDQSSSAEEEQQPACGFWHCFGRAAAGFYLAEQLLQIAA